MPFDATSAYQPVEHVGDSSDCNDGDEDIYPGAAERGNQLDDDCDGQVDEGLSPVED